MFSSFSSFPIFFGSIPSTTSKSSSFSGAFSCQECWECQTKVLHDVFGGMRCGPARRWIQAQLGVRQAGRKRWLRFFNGERALRDVHSEEFRDWEVEHFTDALVLRSLRAVPGEWRLPVWGHADDINAECFSLLESWSFQTRVPQRTHTQLYGTMCGTLDSIHQNWAAPSLWAELDVPLEATVREGVSSLRMIVSPTSRGAWTGRNYFLYLTSQLLHDKQTWTHRLGLQEKDVGTLFFTNSVLILPHWIRFGYQGVGDIRPACLFPQVKSK